MFALKISTNCTESYNSDQILPRGNIIVCHEVSFIYYADDTQILYLSPYDLMIALMNTFYVHVMAFDTIP